MVSAPAQLDHHPLHRPRPPTPPREHSARVDDDLRDLIGSLDDSFQVEKALRPSGTQSLTDASLQTPPSSGHQSRTAAGNRFKKVDFSPWSKFHRPSPQVSSAPGKPSPIKPLPPSRTLSASRSILKAATRSSPSNGPSTPQQQLCSKQEYDTFPDMLESILAALASEERDVRLDAYMTLLGTLAAHENVPDTQSLRAKTGQLVQCILRDVSAISPTTNGPDSQLSGEACKLLSAMMHIPSVADAIGDDASIAILRKSIHALEDPSSSKALVRTHLFLLSEQSFSPRVMTIDRTGSILDALKAIDERYPGTNVIALRLLVYKKLAQQCPDYMALRASTWLEHTFHGMLSDQGEVRSRAIDASTQIALAIGGNSEASRALTALFKEKSEDGPTYGEFVADKLTSMLQLKSKDGDKFDSDRLQQARQVPQIWAVPVLLFRSRKDKMSTWTHFKIWLNVISQCFNSPDLQTKFQADVAWNRLVYVLMPGSDTEEKMVKMLRQPLLAQLRAKGNERFAVSIRKFALGSYCTLLYYALRPTTNPLDWSRGWDEYVGPVIETLAGRGQREAETASKILLALFGGNPSKLWNENRANEAPYMVSLEEIPELDPKWIRQNLARILQLVQLVMHPADSSELQLGREQSLDQRLWSALLTSLADAASKEITTSKEFKEAIGLLLSFLYSIVEAKLPFHPDRDAALSYACWIATTMIDILKPANFIEFSLKRRDSSEGASVFEIAHTASSPRRDGVSDTPLGWFLTMLICQDIHTSDDECSLAAQGWIDRCLKSRLSRHLKLELISDCLAVLEQQSAFCGNVSYFVWRHLALSTVDILNTPTDHSAPTQLELGHRIAFRLMKAGLDGNRLSTDSDSPARQLLQSWKDCTVREIGPGGVPLTIIDPLAQAATDSLSDARSSSDLIAAARLVILTLDVSEPICPMRFLKSAAKALAKSDTNRRFAYETEHSTQLWTAVSKMMQEFYYSFEEDVTTPLTSKFFITLKAYFEQYQQGITVPILREIQGVLSLWVRDHDAHVSGRKWRKIRREIASAYGASLDAVASMSLPPSTKLQALSQLIAAGLASPFKLVVDISAKTWNVAFGKQESLTYPDDVAFELQRLRSIVDLDLPGFPSSPSKLALNEIRHFDSSDDDTEREPPVPFLDRLKAVSPAPRRIRYSMSPMPRLGTTASAQPSPSNLSVGRPTPRKLRHEDSQIQFEPINSSPPNAGDDFESQHFTEHQMEVRQRQQENAATMFSDLNTSSPARILSGPSVNVNRLPPRPSSARSVQEKLLSSGAEGLEAEPRASTPPLPVPGIGMSDDLPASSPAQSASERRFHASQDGTALHTKPRRALAPPQDDSIFDIPSSPPRPDEDETQSALEETAEKTQVAPNNQAEDVVASTTDESHEHDSHGQPGPISTPARHETEIDIQAAKDIDALVVPATSSDENRRALERAKQSAGKGKVVDSFSAQDGAPTAPETSGGRRFESKDSTDLTERASRTSRKRKSTSRADDRGPKFAKLRRADSIGSGASSSQSGNSQSEWKVFNADDSDVEDCIIVRAATKPGKRGRPRKSNSKATLKLESGPAGPSRVEEAVQVAQTPLEEPSTKRRKVNHNQTSSANLTDEPSGNNATVPRIKPESDSATSSDGGVASQVPEITVPETDSSGTASRKRKRVTIADEADSSGPGQQLAEAQSGNNEVHTPSESRTRAPLLGTSGQVRDILSPSSILRGLRGILEGCKNAVLGSQEEREVDDVLFEIRREVYDASRRARAQGNSS